MKALFPALALAALLAPDPASAGGWTLRVKALNGRETYTISQRVEPGKQASYSGPSAGRGGGPERAMIFNSFLGEEEGGAFRVDYQAEVGGAHRARPPFQAAGKALLRPGKPLQAAAAGGWKLVLELEGSASGKPRRANAGTLEVSLKCGRRSYPAAFAYLPEEQYSAVLFEQEGETVRKLTVGLLPNLPAADGSFNLQYALELKESGEPLASAEGELLLSPGAGRKTARAGGDCLFSVSAAR